jgi:site-specific recombinase XerD
MLPTDHRRKHYRQKGAFRRESESPLPGWQGFHRHPAGETLDKIMNGRKSVKHGAAADYGSDRKHLTGREVEQLIEAAKGSRNEARDRCLLLVMFRHGLRVSEHPITQWG